MKDEARPDIGLCRRFLEKHPAPGRLLLCSVTGSHLYGFSSPDSDLDIKGIHLGSTRDLLGLGQPARTHNRLEDFEGVECDLTTNEAGLALKRSAGEHAVLSQEDDARYRQLWPKLAEMLLEAREKSPLPSTMLPVRSGLWPNA
jgi:predicted nucleotidyltransferase